EHELEAGDPRAASSLLAEIAEPPLDLAKRVRAALVEKQAEDQRRSALVADLDQNVGRDIRRRTSLIVAGGWIVLTLFGTSGLMPQTHLAYIVMGGIAALVATVVSYLNRNIVFGSALNRASAAIAILMPVAYGLLHGLLILSGLPASVSPPLHLFCWFLASS